MKNPSNSQTSDVELCAKKADKVTWQWTGKHDGIDFIVVFVDQESPFDPEWYFTPGQQSKKFKTKPDGSYYDGCFNYKVFLSNGKETQDPGIIIHNN